MAEIHTAPLGPHQEERVMPYARSARLTFVVLLGLFILSLPLLDPIRAAQTAEPAIGAGRAALQQPATLPAPARPPKPALQLSFAAGSAHTGAPVGLTIQATDGAGQPDPSHGSSVRLQLSDADAAVMTTGASSAALAGAPKGPRQELEVPLTAGLAGVVVTFAHPGRQTALAIADDGRTAGEAAIQILPVLVRIQGPATVTAGEPSHYTLTAADDSGSAVDRLHRQHPAGQR